MSGVGLSRNFRPLMHTRLRYLRIPAHVEHGDDSRAVPLGNVVDRIRESTDQRAANLAAGG